MTLLHEALVEIVKEKGPSIIYEKNFISELAKYGVFIGKPYLQEDMEGLINNGDLLIFKDKENWEEDKNYYKTMIASKYPFRVERIFYILESIAASLYSIYKIPQNYSNTDKKTKKRFVFAP